MSNVLSMGAVSTHMTITVTDNWYAIFTERGRLLSVGTWLPPECPGIATRLVTHDEARALLATLTERTHETGPVGAFDGVG